MPRHLPHRPFPRLLPGIASLALLGALTACSTGPSITPTASATSQPPVADDSLTADEWLASFGEFDEQVITGGAGVTELSVPAGATALLITAKYVGDSNFYIGAYDAAGEPAGRVVNHVGDYEGTSVLGFGFEVATTLRVDTDGGSYTITLSPLTSVPAFDIPSEGTGDAVFLSEFDAVNLIAENRDPARSLTVDQENPADDQESVHIASGSAEALPLTDGPVLVIVRGENTPWRISR